MLIDKRSIAIKKQKHCEINYLFMFIDKRSFTIKLCLNKIL